MDFGLWFHSLQLPYTYLVYYNKEIYIYNNIVPIDNIDKAMDCIYQNI